VEKQPKDLKQQQKCKKKFEISIYDKIHQETSVQSCQLIEGQIYWRNSTVWEPH